jgi:iron complex outermembrane receptor protein
LTAWACGVGALCVAWPAEAASTRQFRIPPKAYSEALIDLALQADVSLLGASVCRGTSRVGLNGTYTLEGALQRLLEGAPCSYRIVDARTVRILPLAAPTARETPVAVPLITELLVTATKRRQSADRLAAAISVLSHDQLEATRATDPGETTGQTAGVIMTNLGPGRDKLLMRGLSDGAFTGRARSTVGTYLDETPINYNAPDPDLRLADVDRVEVVRGPQGALYGAGSLSGVYRIVTRKPDLETMSASLGAAYAWTQGGSPSQSVDGYGNLPLVHGRVGIRISGYRETLGGYLDDVNLRRSNVDQTVREGGRVTLRAQLSDDWIVDLSGTTQHLKSNDTQYTTSAARPRQRANRVAEAHDNDFSEAALTVHGALGWANLTSSTAYVRHNYSSQYDASAALDLYSPNGSDLGVYSEAARVEMLVQDLVLTSAREGRFGWLAGLYGAGTVEETPSVLQVRSAKGPLTPAYQETRRDRLRELAVYGEASYEWTPGWTVAAGARLFDTHLRATSEVTVPPPYRSRSLDRSAGFSGVSPKLSLQWDLGSGDLLYALASEGYRAGGINSSGLAAPGPKQVEFQPDRLRNFELGAKLKGFDGRLAARGAVFYDLWRNIQTDQYRSPSGLAYTANVGDAQIGGLEAELAYAFDFGLSVQANTLLSAPRFTRVNPDFASRLAPGLPGTPKVSAGLLAVYRRPLTARMALRLSGEASYVGRSRLTFEMASPTMGDYVKAKLSAGVTGPGWAADLFVSNPANDSGDTFAYGNPFSFGQVRQVTPQRPRTAGVALTATF